MNKPTDCRTYVQSGQSLLVDRPEIWDSLSGGVPFRQTVWMKPWWEQFGREHLTCFITVVDRDDQIRGILPLQRYGRRGWQSVAAGLCTDYVSVLARQDDLDWVTTEIADFLIEHARHPELGWDQLHCEGVVAGDPGTASLVRHLRPKSNVRIESRMNVWYKSCEDDWETYLQNKSRKQRHRLRSMLRIFEQSEKTVEVRFANDPASVTNYLNCLIELHQRHWVENGQTGSFATRQSKTFIHDAAMKAFARCRLCLPVLFRLDPQTGQESIIAAQLHFIGDDDRLYCYSTGVNYDHSDLSPGTLLNMFLIRFAHDGDYVGIDLMRGDEDYKSRLGAEPLPLLSLDLFAPTVRGQIRRIAHDGLFRIKQFYRRRRQRETATEFSFEDAFAECYRERHPVPQENGPVEIAATDNLLPLAIPNHVINAAFNERDQPMILPFR